eukprot:SAG22_NODE_1165_length_5292_cov_9.601964_4_plen_112_part_00
MDSSGSQESGPQIACWLPGHVVLLQEEGGGGQPCVSWLVPHRQKPVAAHLAAGGAEAKEAAPRGTNALRKWLGNRFHRMFSDLRRPLSLRSAPRRILWRGGGHWRPLGGMA